jgi:hypothetical protein
MSVPNEEWTAFLDSIAVRVDALLLRPVTLDTFRQKIQPFRERWEKHNAESDRFVKDRMEHWQKVKHSPRLQDKAAGPPKKAWEWDKGCYLTGLPTHNVGPEHEIPAKYLPALMTAVETAVEHSTAETRRYPESSHEYQRLAESIPTFEQDLVELHREFDGLTPAEKTTAWIKAPCRSARTPNRVVTEFQWWLWLDMTEEDAFGCWRPPLPEIPEHPVERLIPLQDTMKLMPPRDRAEEYERYYVSLASIHDHRCPGSESITGGVWPAELAEQVWRRFSRCQPYGPDRTFVEAALNRVRAELEMPPGQTNEKGQANKAPGDDLAESLRQYAQSVLRLCEGRELPYFETGTSDRIRSDTEQRLGAEWLQVAKAILEEDWRHIRRWLEKHRPNKVQTLKEMRQEILNLMKPRPMGGVEHLASDGHGRFRPDTDLECAIRLFANELSDEANTMKKGASSDRPGQKPTGEERTGHKTLSFLVPDLAVFDRQPEVARAFTLISQAHVAARYASDHHFSPDDKKRLKLLFRVEYDKALFAMRDLLTGLNLHREERNYRNRQYESLNRQARGLLHESLETNVVDHDRFGELQKDLMQIAGGTVFDTGSGMGGGIGNGEMSFLTGAEPARRAPAPQAENADEKSSGQRQPGPISTQFSHGEGTKTDDGHWKYLSGVRGIVDTMLDGTAETRAGEIIRVDPQRVKERFKERVLVFLAAWRRWHASPEAGPVALAANPINWPKDITGVFTQMKDACFYTTLALIHDCIASAIEPNGRIIDSETEDWKGLKSVMYHHCILGQDQQAGYTRELIDKAARAVQDDLIQHCKLPADQQKGESNIQGMSWQEAKDKAEDYVAKHGFPGITRLTKAIGCAENTVRKAISNSESLTKAKGDYDQRHKQKTVVSLSEAVLAVQDSHALEPDGQADINLLVSEKTPEQLIAGIIESTKLIETVDAQATPSNDQTLRSTLANCTPEQLAELYRTRKAEANECHQDDPVKPGHRKQL